MNKILLNALLLFLATQAVAQNITNPFDKNRTLFNQKDIISIFNDPGKGTKQLVYGYDWDEARRGNKWATLDSLSGRTYATNSSDGYITIESGNFGQEAKDEVFYLVEKNNSWNYGVTEIIDSIGPDSTVHFQLPLPNFIAHTATASNYSHPCVTVGDFNGDGLEEVAVGWTQGANRDFVLQILTFVTIAGELTVKEGIEYNTGEISKRSDGQTDAISIGSGDLNNDGTDEIFITGIEDYSGSPDDSVSYQGFLKVFDVSEDTKFSISAKKKVVFDNKNITGNPIDVFTGRRIEDGSLGYIRTACIGTLPTSNLKDEGQENVFISMGVDWNNIQMNSNYNNIFSYSVESFNNLDSFYVQHGPSIINGGSGPTYDFEGNSPFELEIGDINGDYVDDIALLTTQLNIYTFDDNKIIEKTINPVNVGINLSETNPYGESVDRLGVGDIDFDGIAEVFVQSRRYDSENFAHIFQIRVYKQNANISNDTTFDLLLMGAYDYDVKSGNQNTHYGFDMGNLDGNDIRLGDPTIYDCDYVKPTLILEAVPSHFDIIDGVQYDPSSCYGSNSCDNLVVFEHSTTDGASGSVTLSSDWQVSADVSASLPLGKLGLETSLGYQYGEGFSKMQGTSATKSITLKLNATTDDQLKVQVFPFKMYEYPVLDAADDTVTYLVCAFPDVSENAQKEVEYSSKDVYNYLPDHEVGNMLSYPKPNNIYYDSPDYNDYIIFDDVDLNIRTGGSSDLDFIDEKFNETSNTTTKSKTISASIGVNGFGLGASLSSEFTESEMKVVGQSFSKAETFRIEPAEISSSVWNYTVVPHIYWTRDNALKLGMSVDFSNAGLKWQELYGAKADPALNMPYRFNPVLGEAFDSTNTDKTKSMYFDIVNPNPDDTVTAFIKIFNYSLKSTDQKVQYSLFIGHPERGGKIISDINNNTLFETAAILEDQGRETNEIRFVVTKEMIANDVTKVYIQLDPNDEIDEIHDENNIGYVYLGFDCNIIQDQNPIITNIEKDYQEQPTTFSVYPNPALDMVNIVSSNQINNSNIFLYNISGKLVKTVSTSSRTTEINISDLNNGIYFYKIICENGDVFDGKLAVQR